jgi:hypothetical protein
MAVSSVIISGRRTIICSPAIGETIRWAQRSKRFTVCSLNRIEALRFESKHTSKRFDLVAHSFPAGGGASCLAHSAISSFAQSSHERALTTVEENCVEFRAETRNGGFFLRGLCESPRILLFWAAALRGFHFSETSFSFRGASRVHGPCSLARVFVSFLGCVKYGWRRGKRVEIFHVPLANLFRHRAASGGVAGS